MDIAKGVEKPCPICGITHKADEAEVLKSGAILYKFFCSICDWPYVKRVKAPKITVEPLEGFKRRPYRWIK